MKNIIIIGEKYIIGIGGVSNSGKTKLALSLKEIFTNKAVKLICQDEYVYPTSQIPCIKSHTNWEIPESINRSEFKKAIVDAAGIYDIVIVDGLMIYNDLSMNALYHRKIFIEISKNTFLERKRNDLRWGIEPEWYIQHIWDNYLIHGQCPEGEADIIKVNGERNFKIGQIIKELDL